MKSTPELIADLARQCRPTKSDGSGVDWGEIARDLKAITGFLPDADEAALAFRGAGFWVRVRDGRPRSVRVHRGDWEKVVGAARAMAFQERERQAARLQTAAPSYVDQVIARNDARWREMDRRIAEADARARQW